MSVMSNHRHLDCLLNRLFKGWSKKTSKLRVNGLCEGNSLVTSEFPTQRVSNVEIVSIWLCHHVLAPSECWEFIANGNIFVIFWSIMALIVKTWLTFGVEKINGYLNSLSTVNVRVPEIYPSVMYTCASQHWVCVNHPLPKELKGDIGIALSIPVSIFYPSIPICLTFKVSAHLQTNTCSDWA